MNIIKDKWYRTIVTLFVFIFKCLSMNWESIENWYPFIFNSFTVTFEMLMYYHSLQTRNAHFSSQVSQRFHFPITKNRHIQIPIPPNGRQRPPISSNYPHRTAAKLFWVTGHKWGRRRSGLGKGLYQDTDKGGPQVFYWWCKGAHCDLKESLD